MDYKIVDGVYKGPEVSDGNLDLRGTPIKDLGCLKSVEGSLYLGATQIASLGCLKSVKGNLFLKGTPIKDLGNLKSVGDWLDLQGTQVTSLGNLKSVKGNLFLPDNTYIKDFESYKKEAEDFLKETKPLDYTIHMNHKNWIVRTKINNYLETLV